LSSLLPSIVPPSGVVSPSGHHLTRCRAVGGFRAEYCRAGAEGSRNKGA
jgi:hypothetical protein